MLRLKSVLLVDDSRVFREMMRMVFAVHADRILTASGCLDAIERIESNPELELVVTDVVLPDGDGFEVLQHVQRMAEPRPQVMLVTASPTPEREATAQELGAIAYLAKPITFRAIAAAWRRHHGPPFHASPRLHSPWAAAYVVDRKGEAHQVLCWDIHDLRAGGAFLVTEGPLEPGTELELDLELPGRRVRLPAVVVRVQEPAWGAPGGVGVRFHRLDAEAEQALAELLAGADDA